MTISRTRTWLLLIAVVVSSAVAGQAASRASEDRALIAGSDRRQQVLATVKDLVSIVVGDLPTPSRVPIDLEVMTFNIRYGSADDGANRWQRRRALVVDLLRGHYPDIVGIQEAQHDQVMALDAGLENHAWIGEGRLGGTKGEYTPIFYDRTRFEVVAEQTFWLSATPDVPGSASYGNRLSRICTWGRFREKNTGREFLVYNFHLDHQSQAARVESVQQILRHIDRRKEELPVVLTGDFNADMKNPALAPLWRTDDSGEPRYKSAFAVTAPHAEGVGTFHYFEGVRHRAKIDFVLVDSGFDVLGAAILRDHRDGRYPSDHFPVRARLRLR